MHINELSSILNRYFNFHKARSDCFAQLIRAMITVKTVNFTHLATSFMTQALPESNYKRIQRFFRFFQFDAFAVASMVIALFGLKNKKLTLALDRTNWKFGKLDINILMLTATYRGIAIPLMWCCLPKKGNSNTSERIDLIKRIILLIGAKRIECLLGDREFVGQEWIKWGRSVYLSVRWSYNKDEFVTLISNRSLPNPFKTYRKRWEIETFFGCLKKRGFCFEDTHLIHLKRIENLICVLVIGFCWSYLVGEWKDGEMPIKTKSHSRKSKSLFRYGFDELRRVFLNLKDRVGLFLKWLKLLVINECSHMTLGEG